MRDATEECRGGTTLQNEVWFFTSWSRPADRTPFLKARDVRGYDRDTGALLLIIGRINTQSCDFPFSRLNYSLEEKLGENGKIWSLHITY
jgi:hypothetical protein